MSHSQKWVRQGNMYFQAPADKAPTAGDVIGMTLLFSITFSTFYIL